MDCSSSQVTLLCEISVLGPWTVVLPRWHCYVKYQSCAHGLYSFPGDTAMWNISPGPMDCIPSQVTLLCEISVLGPWTVVLPRWHCYVKYQSWAHGLYSFPGDTAMWNISPGPMDCIPSQVTLLCEISVLGPWTVFLPKWHCYVKYQSWAHGLYSFPGDTAMWNISPGPMDCGPSQVTLLCEISVLGPWTVFLPRWHCYVKYQSWTHGLYSFPGDTAMWNIRPGPMDCSPSQVTLLCEISVLGPWTVVLPRWHCYVKYQSWTHGL